MVTSMPTTSRLMQQMARMRLGWVCFLPASTAVAASLPVSDGVGVLLGGKGLNNFDAGPAKRILSIPFARYGLLPAPTNYPKWQAALWQWEDTRQPQYESGAERLWAIVVIVDGRQTSITVFRDAPIDAGQDGEVQAA